MASAPPKIRPSDLPTKRVRAPDGSIYPMKVVQSDSPTLEYDILAAFRWNVRRIKSDQRSSANGRKNAAKA